MKKGFHILVLLTLIYSCSTTPEKKQEEPNLSSNIFDSKVSLGDALYHDVNLSINRSMSCATCHKERTAFTDDRPSFVGHMAAMSADDKFMGDRNVPTVSYASYIPDFDSIYEDGKRLYIGGYFLDGRAFTLKEQAKGPFTNPVEMQMPNEASVVKRVLADSEYKSGLQQLYHIDIADTVAVFDAIADAISVFERDTLFAPFDSKYDRFLVGDYQLTSLEKEGLELFKNTERANCIACHPLESNNGVPVLFTDFTYDNLGVPANTFLRLKNKKPVDFIDHGLLDNPLVSDSAMDGNFRVSSLRNSAASPPFMHNGIFKELKTVVHFYNTRDVVGALNPETNSPWKNAEVPATVNKEEMGDIGLSDAEEDAIVAFLKTLVDQRYEHLIKK